MKATYFSQQLTMHLAHSIRLPNAFVLCWDFGFFLLVNSWILYAYAPTDDTSMRLWHVLLFVGVSLCSMVFVGAYQRSVLRCPVRRSKRHLIAMLITWCSLVTLSPLREVFEPFGLNTWFALLAGFFVTNALRPLLIDILERTGRAERASSMPY